MRYCLLCLRALWVHHLLAHSSGEVFVIKQEQIKKYSIGSQDGLGKDAKVLVKYFNPAGVGTWLITEGNKLDNGDYELFGYCHLGDDLNAEFGYVLLSELENIKLPFGLKIERDLYLNKDCKLIEAMKLSGITPPDFLFFTSNI